MPRSPVAGFAGAVRILRLTPTGFAAAESHGKRLDQISQARRVREADPISSTGLNLALLKFQHVQGYFQPATTTKALHLLLQWPVELTDGNDAEGMLRRSRQFAEQVFGPGCIFADRIDRDETSLHVVDLFLLPKYVKRTKHTKKNAISITYHLKKLAIEKGWIGDEPPLLRQQGIALQTAWHEFLRDEVQIEGVKRGSPKKQPGDDWLSPEQLAIVRDREDLDEDKKRIENEAERLRAMLAEVAERIQGATRLEEAATVSLGAADTERAKAKNEAALAQQATKAAQVAIAERELAILRDREKLTAEKTRVEREADRLRSMQADVARQLHEATRHEQAARANMEAAAEDRAEAKTDRKVAAYEAKIAERQLQDALLAEDTQKASSVAAQKANEALLASAVQDRAAAAADRAVAAAEIEKARVAAEIVARDRATAALNLQKAAAALEKERQFEEETALNLQTVSAMSIGISAWASCEILGVQPDSQGKHHIRFSSEETKVKLWDKILPAMTELIKWIQAAARDLEKRISTAIEQRAKAAVTHADIEAAAARMVRPEDLQSVLEGRIRAKDAADATHRREIAARGRAHTGR